MRYHRILCLITLIATSAGTATGAAARTRSKNPCATKSPADLLCRSYGSVTHASPSTASPSAVAVGKAGVKLPYGSTVSVGSNSLATMNFARQAQCALGLYGTATELVTRFGGDPLQAPPLYWQRTGTSRCTIVGRARPQDFFCDLSVTCPVVVTTSGHVQEITSVGSPARISSLAHAAEITTTPVKLDFCAGAFKIDVSDEFGGGSVKGAGSVMVNGVTEVAHIRVTIRKIETITQTATGTIEDHEIYVDSDSVAGRGDCADPVFEQQQRWAARR